MMMIDASFGPRRYITVRGERLFTPDTSQRQFLFCLATEVGRIIVHETCLLKKKRRKH